MIILISRACLASGPRDFLQHRVFSLRSHSERISPPRAMPNELSRCSAASAAAVGSLDAIIVRAHDERRPFQGRSDPRRGSRVPISIRLHGDAESVAVRRPSLPSARFDRTSQVCTLLCVVLLVFDARSIPLGHSDPLRRILAEVARSFVGARIRSDRKADRGSRLSPTLLVAEVTHGGDKVRESATRSRRKRNERRTGGGRT